VHFFLKTAGECVLSYMDLRFNSVQSGRTAVIPLTLHDFGLDPQAVTLKALAVAKAAAMPRKSAGSASIRNRAT
jgi:hypothetical protein